MKIDLRYWLDRLEVIEAESEQEAKKKYILMMTGWISPLEHRCIEVIQNEKGLYRHQAVEMVRLREQATGEWR